jgi:hypothetical protein
MAIKFPIGIPVNISDDDVLLIAEGNSGVIKDLSVGKLKEYVGGGFSLPALTVAIDNRDSNNRRIFVSHPIFSADFVQKYQPKIVLMRKKHSGKGNNTSRIKKWVDVGELVQKSNFDEGYIDIANYLNHTDGKMIFEFDNTKSIHTLHLAANGQEMTVQRMLKRFTYVENEVNSNAANDLKIMI